MEHHERTTIREHIAYWKGRVDLAHETGYPPLPETGTPQQEDTDEITLPSRYLSKVYRLSAGLGGLSLVNGVVSGISLASDKLLSPEAAIASIGCNGVLIAATALAIKEQLQSQPLPSPNNS